MNGDILVKLQDKIEAALKRKNLREIDRTMLEVQQLFVIYLLNDHPKTQTMWAVFKPMSFVLITFVVGLIGAIASGKVQIILGVVK